MNVTKIDNRIFYVGHGQKKYLIYSYPFRIFEIDDQHDLNRILELDKPDSKFHTPIDSPNYFSTEFIFSTSCNLACTYCYARTRKTGCYGLKQTNMNRSTIQIAIDFSLEQLTSQLNENNSKKGFLDLYFMGGEPLLNKNNLKYALNYVSRRIKELKTNYNIDIDLQAAISTNGVLIDDDIAKFFKKFKFTYVGITIDGPNHNDFRKFSNGKGTLNQVLRGVKNLVKHDVNFKIVTVIPPGNVNTIDKYISYLNKLKILPKAKRISIIPRAPNANELYRLCPVPQTSVRKLMEGTSGSRYTNREKIAFSKKIIEISNKYNVDERDIKRKMLELINKGGSLYHCPAAINKISVVPDGTVFPCHQLVNIDKFRMGNLHDNRNINKTTKYRNVVKIFTQRTVDKIDKCQNCVFQSICPPLVDCPARSYLEENSLYKTPQYCDIYLPYINQIFTNFLNKISITN
jgi:uncharacterized protein